MARRFSRLLPVFCLLLASTGARAANIFEKVTAAPILELDPSVRWRAMGDAGTAAFWDAAHAWANPALLGTARGIQYETGSMDRDLVDFETARTTLGWGGVGLSTTGRPIPALGKVEMEFGGLLSENVESWSVGVSAAQVATTIARFRGEKPAAFTRWMDLSIGYSEKQVEEEFAFFGAFSGSLATDRVTARDLGVLLHGYAPLGPARLDLAYGYADINTNEPRFSLGLSTARDTRNGIAARLGWNPAAIQSRIPGWLEGETHPLVSASWAMDFVHTTLLDETSRGWGAEVGLANVLFGRIGHIGSSEAWGLGVGVPLGRFAAVRWDHVYRERIDGIPDERSNAWTVWMDPLAIYAAAR